jgi:hypothetical protein
MTYIVQRHQRFYVVAYDGLDPLTGRERRRWHPVGPGRSDADALAASLAADRTAAPPTRRGTMLLADFLRTIWLLSQ